MTARDRTRMWECPECHSNWFVDVGVCPVDGTVKEDPRRAAPQSTPKAKKQQPSSAPARGRHRRRRRFVGVAIVIVVAAAGGVYRISTSGRSAEGPVPALSGSPVVDLLANCPERIVVQLDWLPRVEQGAFFGLLTDDIDVDPQEITVSGAIRESVGVGSHTLELRGGTPGIDFESVESVLTEDHDVLLGYTSTDQQLLSYPKHPTIGVGALLAKSSQAIVWDRRLAPGVSVISDLATTSGDIRVDAGSTFAAWLGGILDHRIDDLWFGSGLGDDPSLVAQSAIATVGPYQLSTRSENPIDVGYQLLFDAGWQPAAGVLSVRSDGLGELSPCLSELVPLLQRSQREFLDDPNEAIGRIVSSGEQLGGLWAYSRATAENAVAVMKATGMVATSSEEVLGQFDMTALSTFIDVYTFTVEGSTRVAVSSLVTNRFVDTSVLGR